MNSTIIVEEDPLWYKNSVVYEVHIKSFYDSNGDGIGDFRGLIQKLDYLMDLGINVLWLLPFYPSPLLDDGYDIADYMNINPDYGTMADFRELLRQAHSRGIRVITELVLNHTSDEHAWFQRARRAKAGSSWRDFYVWSDSADKYGDARIIFQDFESSNWSWDPVAKAYYWHRFYSHQPDLNFDNPQVHKALFRVLDFWLGMGVDGVRLDAIPYLYEREGTNCENLPETYVFLKTLRKHLEEKFRGRLLLAEANQWPEDAVAYFGEGDACHMAFHFPLMPRMFMSVQMEDRFPIIDILEQTPHIPENCQWGLFLRNHDELTLEMVTDEERDYMYRVYAHDPRARINLGIRRRLAPLMGNDRRKIELMNVLLFTMPGTPILYYGDELGMGDNYYLGDRNGVRTPMQWSPDRNAGFSACNPQRLFLPTIIDPEYHYETVNVENQAKNPSSLLWWMRRMIDLRKRFNAFGRGSIQFLLHDNPKVLSFVRTFQNETIFVVVNLSRHSQSVEVKEPRFAGYIPEDLFSRNKFPLITSSPYVFIISGYAYHILLMEKEPETAAMEKEVALTEIRVEERWERVLEGKALDHLERNVLQAYLRKMRWFGGKGRRIDNISISNKLPLAVSEKTAFILFLAVSYLEGGAETFILPIAYENMDKGQQLLHDSPQAIISLLRVDDREGVLYDALYSDDYRKALFQIIAGGRKAKVTGGELGGWRTRTHRSFLAKAGKPETSQILKVEQTNTSLIYDKGFYLKLYRRLQEGTNPEVEMGLFLSEKAGFKGVAPLLGTLEYRGTGAAPVSMAMLQGFIASESDGWSFTLGEIGHFFDRVRSKTAETGEIPPPVPSLFSSNIDTISPLMRELIGGFYLEMMALLGRRTAELHAASASMPDDRDFTPEPYSLLYQRSVYQSMRSLVRKVLTRLGKNLDRLPDELRADAERVLAAQDEILHRQRRVVQKKLAAMKIRIHGDYHLGQVLYTGKDFIIIDFEGEPARAVSERRIKRSPLRDVAGMIRSFYYAPYVALLHDPGMHSDGRFGDWAESWYRHVSGVFFASYMRHAVDAGLLPRERDDLELMLDVYTLDKAVYELGYELDNRPDWVSIPVRGILGILEKPAHGGASTP